MKTLALAYLLLSACGIQQIAGLAVLPLTLLRAHHELEQQQDCMAKECHDDDPDPRVCLCVCMYMIQRDECWGTALIDLGPPPESVSASDEMNDSHSEANAEN